MDLTAETRRSGETRGEEKNPKTEGAEEAEVAE
jgi:hypothetical protein